MKKIIITKLTENDSPGGPLIGYRRDDISTTKAPPGQDFEEFVNAKLLEWTSEATLNGTNGVFWFVIYRWFEHENQPLPEEYLNWIAQQEAEEAERNKPVLSGEALSQILKTELQIGRNLKARYQLNKIFDELYSVIEREKEITEEFYNEHIANSDSEFRARCSFSNEPGAKVTDVMEGKDGPVLGSNKINETEADGIVNEIETKRTNYRFAQVV